MEFLILWILFGIVSAVVASNKGRNGCGWFALGVLLGPFAFILALVLPKNQEIVEQNAVNKGIMKKCPHCAELIKSEATKCRYCGSELVLEDYTTLTKYQLEAEQGDESAQFSLGQIYARGGGIPQDLIKARMWLNLASRSGEHTEALKLRDMVAREMTPTQIHEAYWLASQWIEKHKSRQDNK